MIELKDTTQVFAFWFVPITWNGEETADWLCCILKQDGGTWQAIYRFRYHRDDEVFDSDDVKSWTVADSRESGPEAPADLVAIVDAVALAVAAGYAPSVKRVLVHGNGDKAVEVISKQDFANVRVVGPNESEPN